MNEIDIENKKIKEIFYKEKENFYKKCGTLNINAKYDEFEKYANNVIDEYFNFIKKLINSLDTTYSKKKIEKTINALLKNTNEIVDYVSFKSHFKKIEEIDEFKYKYVESLNKFNNYSNENLIYKEIIDDIELIDWYCDENIPYIDAVKIMRKFYAVELVDIKDAKSNKNTLKELYLQIIFNLLNTDGDELRMSDLKYNQISYSSLNLEKILNANYYGLIDCTIIELYKDNEITLNAMKKILNKSC